MADVETINAESVEEGMYLSALGDGYVVDFEEVGEADFRDRHNLGLARDKVCITFHDANGEENYLLLQPDCPVQVRIQ